MALIHGFAACDLGRIFLRAEERSEQEADDFHAQGDSECRYYVPRDDKHHGLLASCGKSMEVCPTLKCSLAVDQRIQSCSVLKKAVLVVRKSGESSRRFYFQFPAPCGLLLELSVVLWWLISANDMPATEGRNGVEARGYGPDYSYL
jgi:hypothetical protein